MHDILLAGFATLAVAAAGTASAQPAKPVDPIEANDPDFIKVFGEQYEKAFGEGAISAKNKQLSGATLSVVVKCADCLKYHVKMAIKLGATRQEIVEALRIGLVAGGSAGIPTMRTAYQWMDEAGLK